MIVDFQPGDIIDERLEVIDDIGGGGYGKVLKVRDINNEEVFALKYCTSEDHEDIRRFNREIRIMEGIKHENVIEILSSNVEHSPPYFTMPIANKSLSNMLTELQGDTDRIIEMMGKISTGIGAIHSSGHTHRDIKPDNILVFEDGRVVVSDLGLAKFNVRESTVLTRSNIYMGTQGYIPPEFMQSAGTKNADQRGDIFQLGKTFYELLSGLNPIVLNPQSVPVNYWYVIQKATRDDPNERYQSIGQFYDAILDAKRASDPSLDINSQIEQLFSVADEKLKNNEYDNDNLRKILQLIFSLEDEEDVIAVFNKIPNKLLTVYSSNFISEFEPVLEAYSKALALESGGYMFSFAETVSTKMVAVFNATSSPNLKKLSVVSTLIVSVKLNRYAAMDDFDFMLRKLKSAKAEDAYAVASGLRDEISLYESVYSRVPKKELHPAIQVVWEATEKLINERQYDY
ncbi:protein kinase domain-containing protein [Jeotgalibacillus malaysiensis]|uniref:protein kinase domain-containing protein n=1 Tax=Jeotgalibacillus malaysiensis TaxID=1508404 RepID=UPI00385172E2